MEQKNTIKRGTLERITPQVRRDDSSYFCKISKSKQVPISLHAKGWSPEMDIIKQKKLVKSIKLKSNNS